MDLLIFEPIYKERVWGGQNIASFFNREIPKNKPIGESWEIVDRPDDQSVVSRGQYKNKTLRSLLQEFPDQIMGPGWPPEKPFPILVKWLDCHQRLSLQVHPPKEMAESLKGEPKSENWYFVDTQSDASVFAGFKEPVSPENFKNSLQNSTPEEYVAQIQTKPGDSLFIPSGRIHAIDAGNLILEIQQNSDTTYRVSDWGRVALDGIPRELHVEKSLQSIDFQDVAPELIHQSPGVQGLVDIPEFSIVKTELKKGDIISFNSGEEACLLSLISGILSVEHEDNISFGANVLIPYLGKHLFEAIEDSVILITNQFS